MVVVKERSINMNFCSPLQSAGGAGVRRRGLVRASVLMGENASKLHNSKYRANKY